MNIDDKHEADKEKKQKAECEVKEQLKASKQFLHQIYLQEQKKRQQIAENLAGFHQKIKEAEPQIQAEMEKKYLSDGKVMLEKIKAMKAQFKDK